MYWFRLLPFIGLCMANKNRCCVTAFCFSIVKWDNMGAYGLKIACSLNPCLCFWETGLSQVSLEN